ncbi:MAG: DUF975 family protein [Candidatus Levyibacteriota bacterium]
MKKLSISASLQNGWEIYKANWKLILILFIGVYVFLGIVSGVLGSIAGENSGLRGLFQLVNLALSVIAGVGLLKVTLNFVDKKAVHYSQLYTYYPRAFRYFIAGLCYGLIVLGGLFLLVIPGIVWAVKYHFATYFIVDKNTGIREAFKKSGEITRGHKLDLLLFGFIVLGLNFVGAILFGVGLLISGPVTALATADIYRKLSKD